DLDELTELAQGGRAAIAAMETAEKQRTGIQSLKVRYNKIFGFYIEITKANLHLVPQDYQRKSSTVGAERFATAALSDHEARGRHPVVERALAQSGDGPFVPNDVELDAQRRLIVLTGPNMAGKSTAMRQVALIAVLAQTGSFVPAARARVGVVDRLFTRVGAADDLARGQSTFMVEMAECARILHQATPRSLLILDEVGRGSSTFDGLALAWAIAEHLHDQVGAR